MPHPNTHTKSNSNTKLLAAAMAVAIRVVLLSPIARSIDANKLYATTMGIPANKITEDNLRQIYSILGVHTNLDSDKIENGIELSRKFYETYGEPMIHEKFSDYEN